MNTNEIIQNSKDISLVNVGQAKSEFCKIWPNAKNGLEVLISVVKNPIAKLAISTAIAAGDAVSKNICN